MILIINFAQFNIYYFKNKPHKNPHSLRINYYLIWFFNKYFRDTTLK